MDYNYSIMTYPNVEEDLRGLFGINEEILPDEVIHSLTNMPAAELEVADRITTALTALTEPALTKAKLAILYISAANCLTAVKVNVLRLETDNKTTGQRFEDALKVTEEELRAKANKYIAAVEVPSTGNADLLEFVKPSIDQITGDAYAS